MSTSTPKHVQATKHESSAGLGMGIVCNMADEYGLSRAGITKAIQSQGELTAGQLDDLHDLLADMIADLLHFGWSVSGLSPAHPDGIAPTDVVNKALMNFECELQDHLERAGDLRQRAEQ